MSDVISKICSHYFQRIKKKVISNLNNKNTFFAKNSPQGFQIFSYNFQKKNTKATHV